MNLDKQIQQLKNVSHEETFDHVRECLKKTRAWDKSITTNDLKHQKRDLQNNVKSFLFHKPLLSMFAFFAIYLFFSSIIAFFVVSIAVFLGGLAGIYVRLFGIFLILFLSIFLLIKFVTMTPKSQIGYHERWENTLKLYLEEPGIKSLPKSKRHQEARRRLRMSIGHYVRESEGLKFLISTIWGGIFIGCLPDKEFQIALITYSTEIFNVNPFGAICLFVTPPIFFYYFAKYYLPSSWMQQIVDQIDLLEE